MELELVLKLVGLSCLTILFVTSEPSILLRRYFGFCEENYGEYGVIKRFIFRLITCCLCSGFWIGIIFTQSIFYASIVSVVSELINNRINNGEIL